MQNKEIELKNVSAGYGSKMILHDISLTIPAGKTTIILGENGSGKTTLLRAMTGILSYEGSILVDGKDVKALSSKERAGKIAMLSQMNMAYFSYTVEETVLMGRYRFQKGLFSNTSAKDREKATECMKKTDIYDIRNERIGELSGGQLQRVYMAQMFAQDADYIFLDEPTNHLDLRYRVALEKELKRSGLSAVAVYHEIRTAFNVADFIVLMRNGKVTATGKPEELRNSEILNLTFGMDVVGYLKENND